MREQPRQPAGIGRRHSRGWPPCPRGGENAPKRGAPTHALAPSAGDRCAFRAHARAPERLGRRVHSRPARPPAEVVLAKTRFANLALRTPHQGFDESLPYSRPRRVRPLRRSTVHHTTRGFLLPHTHTHTQPFQSSVQSVSKRDPFSPKYRAAAPPKFDF